MPQCSDPIPQCSYVCMYLGFYACISGTLTSADGQSIVERGDFSLLKRLSSIMASLWLGLYECSLSQSRNCMHMHNTLHNFFQLNAL